MNRVTWRSRLGHHLSVTLFHDAVNETMTDSPHQTVLPVQSEMPREPPREYYEGPTRQLTKEWKQLVKDTLKNNKEGLREGPRSQGDLARLVVAKAPVSNPKRQELDRSAISKLLKPATKTSGIVDAVCEVLHIPPPTIPTPESHVEPDELDAYLRTNVTDRSRALTILRAYFDKP